MKKKRKHESPSEPIKDQFILRFFEENSGKAVGINAILRRLNLKKQSALEAALERLEEKKLIRKFSAGKWILNGTDATSIVSNEHLYQGVVDVARAGFGYVLCKGLTRDIFVSQKNLGSAQDGDFVQVKLARMYLGKPEGIVVKVLQRSKSQFVGLYRAFKNESVVIITLGNQSIEIPLYREDIKNLEDYDRLVIEITKWKEKPNDRMSCKVIKNLGKNKTIDMEMETIIAKAGFSLAFPASVVQESESIQNSVSDLNQRRDFRDITTFTIDPIDAKDFDDAISYQINDKGQLEIGVHIADVSYYVKPDSALDKEALKRGNSVYLVDRVLPMLPERLSNELCSLRPNEDKLTFSVVFTFDEQFEIVHHWIGRTLIHSNRRFSYEEVQEILERKEGDFAQELIKVNQIANHIRKLRLQHGAIDFESEEVRFKLNSMGMPESLILKQRLEAHMLIEEFMLLANKYVAQFMAMKNKALPVPFVYRIHDVPDMDKLEEFMLFAREMGVKINLTTPKLISKSLNHLAQLIRENDDLKILQPLAIRTMAKAAYSPENIGHYGLAFEYYTHFTSPIRRYADLMVHRILFENLTHEKRFRLDAVESQCMYISAQERKAMEAERESTKYFQVLYMNDQIGKEFVGRITGMNDRGFYVELIDSKCEAVLSFTSVPDNIIVNRNRLSAASSVSDKVWKVGERIHVKIISANLDDRELGVEFAGEIIE